MQIVNVNECIIEAFCFNKLYKLRTHFFVGNNNLSKLPPSISILNDTLTFVCILRTTHFFFLVSKHLLRWQYFQQNKLWHKKRSFQFHKIPCHILVTVLFSHHLIKEFAFACKLFLHSLSTRILSKIWEAMMQIKCERNGYLGKYSAHCVFL